ncbi:hypothetical protein [Sphingomonas bacterium]|uniref:hypothetical protein n=1 Tax=Sphingomonas bacterium TaxID=1895847 RepID=UPI001C2D4D19|nr:hypothetical protein [Sphingomonas bacterium]
MKVADAAIAYKSFMIAPADRPNALRAYMTPPMNASRTCHRRKMHFRSRIIDR